MHKNHIGYFFREGLSNMFSHGFMSFAAIGITVACLLIMGTFSLVAVNADAMLKDLEKDNEILAYVDESFSYKEAKALQSELESIQSVTTARFITREKAMNAFKEDYANEPIFEDLKPEILRDRYAIHVSNLKEIGKVADALRETDGIEKVNAYEEISNGFIAVRNVATAVCVALIAILFVVSVFIISNTIKLTTFDRRQEIAIMRMVGATNGFIRWPFVYEGFLLGILSAVVSFLLQWGLYEAVTKSVSNSDTIHLISVLPFSSLCGYVAATFAVAGIVIGVGGSLSAIHKFLKV